MRARTAGARARARSDRPAAANDRPAVVGDQRGRARRRPPVIDVQRVSRVYRPTPELEVRALDDVSLRIERAEHVAIMGTSGSGKSTLMHLLGCLDAPSSGRYLLDGVDTAEIDEDGLSDLRNRKIGFVFQAFNLVPRTSAISNVELPLAYAGMPRAARRERAAAALRAVGMGQRLDHLPSELSGGQQQRVAVARAIVTDPSLILADEPTGNLDSRSTDDVLEIFAELNAEGRTVVLITHEDEVADRADRVVRLGDGRILSDARNLPAGTVRRGPHRTDQAPRQGNGPNPQVSNEHEVPPFSAAGRSIAAPAAGRTEEPT